MDNLLGYFSQECSIRNPSHNLSTSPLAHFLHIFQYQYIKMFFPKVFVLQVSSFQASAMDPCFDFVLRLRPYLALQFLRYEGLPPGDLGSISPPMSQRGSVKGSVATTSFVLGGAGSKVSSVCRG